jgi:hypothetical protein
MTNEEVVTTEIQANLCFFSQMGAPPGALNPNPPGSANGSGQSGPKRPDAKEIMKKRRERAICIDRVSRVIFPSTFILLNIIYWLVFSEILDAIKSTAMGTND